MIIVGKKTKNGVVCYEVKGNDGNVSLYAANMLKGLMQRGQIVIDNAELKGNRLYMKKNFVAMKPVDMGYKRTPNLTKLTPKEKYRYYFDVFWESHNIADMSTFTIDELDLILTASWVLEVGDKGSSNVDVALNTNLYCYPTIAAVFEECIRRGYLTEKQCTQYMIGSNEQGRICNQCTFAQWILKHKKSK